MTKPNRMDADAVKNRKKLADIKNRLLTITPESGGRFASYIAKEIIQIIDRE